MSKHQIINEIRQHNRSADRNFLSLFNEQSLRNYLFRLTALQDRRGRGSVWVRPGDSPAVATRVNAA